MRWCRHRFGRRHDGMCLCVFRPLCNRISPNGQGRMKNEAEKDTCLSTKRSEPSARCAGNKPRVNRFNTCTKKRWGQVVTQPYPESRRCVCVARRRVVAIAQHGHQPQSAQAGASQMVSETLRLRCDVAAFSVEKDLFDSTKTRGKFP